MLFNNEMLISMAQFRENNSLGAGKPIESDEQHEMNAPLDRRWMVIHIIFFWSVLIFFIEYRFHYLCCDPRRMKSLTQDDNDKFFGKASDDVAEIDGEVPVESDGSEVAHIFGEGADIQLRFNVR